MTDIGYKIKGSTETLFDIGGVFSTKAASTLASANTPYYKTDNNGVSVVSMNQFELYSSAGTGHPLQSNLIGYKINNIDITKYYTPIYNNIAGPVNQTITIPNWVKKVAFIIQAAGGNNGNNASTADSLYRSHVRVGVASPGGDPVVSGAGPSFVQGQWSLSYYFVKTTNAVSDNAGGSVFRTGKLYKKGVTYSGGAGSGGTCFAGVYTINEGNRALNMTYVSNSTTVSASYLQFSDTNLNKVTVPNGNNGAAATTAGRGANGNDSTSATMSNTPIVSYINGNSYIGKPNSSGFSLNPTITTGFPLPPSVSFANYGGPGRVAQIIYWFLL